MLTLNTGQTPMSLRQQVEMLFLDYATVPLPGIRLVREAEDETASQLGEYSFKAVIEGFNSYLERNELPIDRYDLLESIKSLEKLARENEKRNLFQDFVETYHAFVTQVQTLTNNVTLTAQELRIQGQPFGLDARRVFSKAQAFSGFGAAIGKLRDFGLINSFDDIRASIYALQVDTPPEYGISLLLQRLESIRLHSKKIGNSQRLYFHFFFRELFNPQSDGYRNIAATVASAYGKYESQTL
jgi:hypothetical protein